jgi:fluoroquinolone transport system permease protein
MKRVAWSVYRDFRIQLRCGYPWATAIAAVLCVAAFARIPLGNSDRLAVFSSLAFSLATTLPFLLLQVNAEIREGSLTLLDLTPLRPHEYLASKAISLAIPSLAMNTAMVLVSRGPYFNPFPFWAGLAAAGILFAWIGFLLLGLAGSPGKAFALSLIVAVPLLAPYFPREATLPEWLALIHPLAGPAAFLGASQASLSVRDAFVTGCVSLTWMLLILVACRRALDRLRRSSLSI